MPKNSHKSKNNDSRPIGNYNFSIEIDGIYEGSFSSVSGVASEVEIEEFSEGGVNHYIHRLPIRVKHSNITLEKGITKSKELHKWFAQTQEGIMNKKDFSIVLNDNKGTTVRRWNFKKGYPVKWEAGNLDAMGNDILMEKIEIAHEGMVESS